MQQQLNFMEAETARDLGMLQAEEHADRVIPDWSLKAFWALKSYLFVSNGKPFLGEDVRFYAEERGLPLPPSKRAWGAVIVKAAREKLIRSVGFGLTKNPTAHRTPATLWVVV